jgi:hypothetical protein
VGDNLRGGCGLFYVIGVLQVRWGFNQMKDYFKVKKFDGVNNPRKDNGNTPNCFQNYPGIF